MTPPLGPANVQRMQSEGWRFDDRGLRLGNGWFVWAQNPHGNLSPQLLGDPEDHPELFAPSPPVNSPVGDASQPELALAIESP